MTQLRRSNVIVHPRPRTRPAAVATVPSDTEANASAEPVPEEHSTPPAAVSSQPKLQTEKRIKKPKRVIPGDHGRGYGRPPIEHQFKLGNKGGPGRPRGSKSQNSLLRAELNRKHVARDASGKMTKKPARELISALVVTGPLTSRDHRDLAKLHTLACDLFPDPVVEASVADAYDPAVDRLVLEHFFKSLQCGEVGGGGSNPLADMATGRPDLGQAVGDDAWAEGDWDTDGGKAGDDDR